MPKTKDDVATYRDPETYGTEQEVAKFVRSGVQTLRNHRTLGIGIPYVKFGRSVRYKWMDVLEYMGSHRIETRCA